MTGTLKRYSSPMFIGPPLPTPAPPGGCGVALTSYPSRWVIQAADGPAMLNAQAELAAPQTAAAIKRVLAKRDIGIAYRIRTTRYATRSWLPSTGIESSAPAAKRCEPTSSQVPRLVESWTW